MMTEGVILAAGCSSRTAPDCKLALRLDGLTVLERSIGSMLPFCSHIFVVTGAHKKLVAGIVQDQEDILLVDNPDFLHGMYGSIKAGLRFTTGDRILILPGDCPFVAPEVFAALLAAEGEIVLPVWQGRAGHPVLLDRSILPSILLDDCNESLHQFISAHTHTCVPVHCAGILQDIDTKEEYRQALLQLAEMNDGR